VLQPQVIAIHWRLFFLMFPTPVEVVEALLPLKLGDPVLLVSRFSVKWRSDVPL
jgi:hypothetical protein